MSPVARCTHHVAAMFSPEMMEQAQKMMANMKPDDMARMTEMASKMDPKTMESMAKSMGGPSANIDAKQMQEQMKNMTPDQMKQGMAQAQNQMGAQKTYMYNGAMKLKNDGNEKIKAEKFSEALESYDRALENMKPHYGDDVQTLKLALLTNSALCHLKMKNWGKTVTSCDEALQLDCKNVKALFRRGQARWKQDKLEDAFVDMKVASDISPDDKNLGKEFAELRVECLDRGIDEKSLADRIKAGKAATTKKQGSSSSSSPSAAGMPGMSDAVERLAKNPEMLEQATAAMKNMSSEDLNKMMENAPLPPGVDAETMKSRMAAVTENPDMLKSAVESLKSLPEEERMKMLSKQGAGGMASMGKVFEDPEMMKQVAEMAKNMAPEDAPEGSEADMMRKAAEQLSANPELGKQMSQMMQNMPPEQLQKMMEMSQNMRGGGGGGGGSSRPSGAPSALGPEGMNGDAMEQMMNDPQMMKAAEEMMSSMTPETLAGMAKASGIDIDEDKAKMIAKFMPLLPYAMKCMRCCGKARKGFKSAVGPKGRWITASVVVFAAVLQHYGVFGG